MQSLPGPVLIENTRRCQSGTMPGRATPGVVAAVALAACLGGCSLIDAKPAAESGQTAARDSAPVAYDDVSQTQVFPGLVADEGDAQPGLDSRIEQLGAEQQRYEARLQALEAIVLRGYPVASVAGYPDMAMPAAASAGQLASLPIEPDVITRSDLSPVTPQVASYRKPPARTPVLPAEDAIPVSTPPPARPAGESGGWVINLGSYASKGVADRMLAEFRRQDIAAEKVTAVVDDTTMYRVRVAAFETRRAAVAHAQSLQDRLGIADVWITRR